MPEDDAEPKAEDLAAVKTGYTPKQLSEMELACRNAFNRPLEFISLDEVCRRTPTYTRAQRDLMQPREGELIANTTDGFLQVYLGGKWLNIVTDA